MLRVTLIVAIVLLTQEGTTTTANNLTAATNPHDPENSPSSRSTESVDSQGGGAISGPLGNSSPITHAVNKTENSNITQTGEDNLEGLDGEITVPPPMKDENTTVAKQDKQDDTNDNVEQEATSPANKTNDQLLPTVNTSDDSQGNSEESNDAGTDSHSTDLPTSTDDGELGNNGGGTTKSEKKDLMDTTNTTTSTTITATTTATTTTTTAKSTVKHSKRKTTTTTTTTEISEPSVLKDDTKGTGNEKPSKESEEGGDDEYEEATDAPVTEDGNYDNNVNNGGGNDNGGQDGNETPEEEDKGKPEKTTKKQLSPRNHDEANKDDSGNFITYFVLFCIFAIGGYVLYHKRKRVMALIVEGRKSQAQRRKQGGKEYSRLSTAEDAMPSLQQQRHSSGSLRQVIY